MKIHTAYLLSGSNIGNRQHFLERALEKMMLQGVHIIKTSSIYETQPWGVAHEGDYLNMAIHIETSLGATGLFALLQQIERSEGRANGEKNMPRTLDIDILFYDDLVLHENGLTIPHPRLHLRRFALVPLAELAPHHIHPLFQKTVAELLQECNDLMEVRKMAVYES